MKRLILLITLAFSTVLLSFSQTKSPYLFKNFSEGTITYKNGQYTIERVNFNLIDGNLYFIDKKDNETKIASPIDQIAFVRVGERTLVLHNEDWLELINDMPELYVQYKTKTRSKGRKVAFDGVSMVASVTNYSDFRDGGQQSMPIEDDREISQVYHYYWLVRGENKKRFVDFKQFVKLFPSKRDLLIQYIEDKKLDFENVDAVVELVKYTQSL